ncbi:hypothetical protein MexAM1_META1p0986 [Methylorubrum extorquens AM1]|uniref:Uncharacterized protein n=1 Tax=Methylorubrum extorquens (strain ATCC 14718 / DSM 1338 / JCM 2805 / NCIMB 9133 / AM1) TaxID=272630 RepID=C5AX42_METEA|nr:hypothetical protein MexAM1_META1p0986 [Methylorubrum extorquens AM1]
MTCHSYLVYQMPMTSHRKERSRSGRPETREAKEATPAMTERGILDRHRISPLTARPQG